MQHVFSSTKCSTLHLIVAFHGWWLSVKHYSSRLNIFQIYLLYLIWDPWGLHIYNFVTSLLFADVRFNCIKQTNILNRICLGHKHSDQIRDLRCTLNDPDWYKQNTFKAQQSKSLAKVSLTHPDYHLPFLSSIWPSGIDHGATYESADQTQICKFSDCEYSNDNYGFFNTKI